MLDHAWPSNPPVGLGVTPGTNTDFIFYCLQFAYECFTQPGAPAPVLIGGAVDSVMSVAPRPVCGPGVTLLAAVLPGVSLYPFHNTTDSAPAFTPNQWQGLLRRPSHPPVEASPPGNPGDELLDGSGSPGGVCGVVFCEPHFVAVETLLRRLHNLLPASTLLGGVVQPDSSAQPHSHRMGSVLPGHGAVFLNSECHREGAVGCLMQVMALVKASY